LKGAQFLAKIHKSLKSKGHKISTFLAGENHQGTQCKKIGGDNLFILDYLEEKEISIMMNICDFFILPSLHETGPQVIYEAKQCQAVCLVSPGGGGRAIKKNGEDGIIINDYNVDVWCKKISNLISDKKKLDFIKRKLKNDNTQKSWKDIFFLKFDSNWKNLLKTQ
jgi:glycosyltransferase involved in cell wall biosynthesis